MNPRKKGFNDMNKKFIAGLVAQAMREQAPKLRQAVIEELGTTLKVYKMKDGSICCTLGPKEEISFTIHPDVIEGGFNDDSEGTPDRIA